MGKCGTYEQCFGEIYKPSSKNSSETPAAFPYFSSDACRILADGVTVCIPDGCSSPIEVYFDLNGPKLPNRQGYDFFYFSIYNDSSISESAPLSYRFDALESRVDLCKNGELSSYGAGCFTYLQQNGFKIDY